jgi:non-ribosomal peptide synthase protein (TIGR01720 family)
VSASRIDLPGAPRVEAPDRPRPGIPVPLSPFQRGFVDTAAGRPRRAPTMTRVLESRREIEADVLWQAALVVSAYHPALRLRVDRDEQGRAIAEVLPERPPTVRAVDLRAVPPDERRAAVAAVLAEERRAVDSRDGPTLRLTAFPSGDGCLVALVADHLVLDEFSWWVLVRDLEAAIVDPLAYEAGRGWAEDAVYLRWLGRLAEHPRTPAGLAGAGFWRTWPPSPLPRTPLDHAAGPRTEEVAEVIDAVLTREETAALRAALPALDLPAALLTAIHAAWREWTGERALPIWLVHHGRTSPLADPGAATMVGCAAHLYPVLIEVSTDDPAGAARDVRRQLAAVPNDGVDHGILRPPGPAPDLLFNFVGSLGRRLDGPVFTRVVPELGGLHNDPEAPRDLTFEIGARVEDGALRVRWTYCRTAHEPATAERLAASARRALLALSR